MLRKVYMIHIRAHILYHLGIVSLKDRPPRPVKNRLTMTCHLVYCFGLGPHPVLLRAYSYLCDQGLLLVVLERPCMVLGIESKLATYKASPPMTYHCGRQIFLK